MVFEVKIFFFPSFPHLLIECLSYYLNKANLSGSHSKIKASLIDWRYKETKFVWLVRCLSLSLSLNIYIYIYIYSDLSGFLVFCFYLSIHPSIRLHIYLIQSIQIYLTIHPSLCLSVYLPQSIRFYLSFGLSFGSYQSTYLSI